MDITQRLADRAASIEAHLAKLLASPRAIHSSTTAVSHVRLADAMRHAVLNGGKRLRPILMIESAALFDVPIQACLTAAAAVECVHCYSLVHDDLPCMDNDELRRGQPTIWKAYDEWTAVLAGDALLTLAFEILSSDDAHHDPEVRLKLISELAVASGRHGMVQGQALDLEASKLANQPEKTAPDILAMQQLKTGALIQASCVMGGHLAKQGDTTLSHLRAFGKALGLAFQIGDDLLDVEGNSTDVGKATGKDAEAGKATLVGLMGIDEARKALSAALNEACAALDSFGEKADALRSIITYVGNRKN